MKKMFRLNNVYNVHVEESIPFSQPKRFNSCKNAFKK